MKQVIATLTVLIFIGNSQAQGLGGLIKKATTKDTTSGKSILDEVSGAATSTGAISNTDIVNGLKEALTKGAEKSSNKLSAVDGFLGNAALKILLPPEAKQVEQSLRSLGMNKQVDDAIIAMNRAAEDAAKSATPIFVDAIKSMNINDAMGILKGTDTAATSYLKGKTTASLTEAFRPVIETSLQKVNATKYWRSLFTSYNMISVNKVNPDLTAYVTERALSGIFLQLGQEEKEIRKNPAARTTELLQKVFGSNK